MPPRAALLEILGKKPKTSMHSKSILVNSTRGRADTSVISSRSSQEGPQKGAWKDALNTMKQMLQGEHSPQTIMEQEKGKQQGIIDYDHQAEKKDAPTKTPHPFINSIQNQLSALGKRMKERIT